MKTTFPTAGRLAGVDYGTVRIGIAVCDPGRILVSPLETRTRTDPEGDAHFFRQLARSERIAGWIVGLPIHCDGGESQKSEESRRFAAWLQQMTQLPARLFDERFTTADASRRLRAMGLNAKQAKAKKSKGRLDAVAAQILLESFLEALRYRHAEDLPGYTIAPPAAADRDPLED